MDHNCNNKHHRDSEHDWQQANDALPILIVERNEASVMSTDALIAAGQSGLRDACENYLTALGARREV